VDDLSGLEFFIKYVPNPIIQEYIDGVEITNDVICDLSGDVLGIVSRRRIEVRWGEVAKGVTIKEPIIWEGCDKIARALPAIGPITVQCILKDGLPYYTEINARLGGGAPLAIAAGVDFPSWLIARTLSLELNIPPIGSYDKDVYITRYDDSLFLNHHDLDEIRRRHI
jgi:carbamoyl-phosphate synthase large subunit